MKTTWDAGQVSKLMAGIGNLTIGQISSVLADGRASVDFPGNPHGPLEARSILGAAPLTGTADASGTRVLLCFENNDPSRPIIVGILHDTLFAKPDVVLDGKNLVLDAEEEIVLGCGKSSMTLRKDGKIVVKGTEIVSRASGAHKIKGASVRIN